MIRKQDASYLVKESQRDGRSFRSRGQSVVVSLLGRAALLGGSFKTANLVIGASGPDSMGYRRRG
jgi:hypothetical protein